MSQYPARVSVTELDGTNGFALIGEMHFQYAGVEVASTDINGDGFDDLIIGAYGDGASGSRGGTAYVVFGQASGFGATVSLSTLNGANGFKMVGGVRGYTLGWSVSSAGDVNGDGFEDIIIGAAYSEFYYEGAAYVIFGTEAPFSADLDLGALDGTNGFKILGPGTGLAAGWFVNSAGDVNGDGFDDVIVTTYTLAAELYTGQTYVVFGSDSDFAPLLDLSDLNGANGFQFVPAPGGSADRASAAGDVNGDGFDDIIVGGITGNSAYVVYGKGSPFAAGITAAGINGTNGFQITGKYGADSTGYDIGSAGDVNGDGFDDFFLTAPDVILDGTTTIAVGEAYVVFGTDDGFPSSWNVASLNGANGFRIRDQGGNTGVQMSSVGDVNGDGFDDVAVSFDGVTTHAGQYVANSVAIVFGRGTGFAARVDISSLDGSNGFIVDVPFFMGQGTRAVSSGDINGDGFSDVIIGNYHGGWDAGLYDAGAVYVVYGRKPEEHVIRAGTLASQTLAGGDFADILAGFVGQDQLSANGGDDRLIGGAGADTLTGGSGEDTFAFAGTSDLAGDLITDFAPASDLLDLTAIPGLTFIGTASFSNVAGQMNYVQQGDLTLLQIDSNGNGIADATLRLSGNLVLSAANFDDGDRPSLQSVSPPDNATNVGVGANIVLTFDRSVVAGTGNIEFRRSSDGATVRSISVGDVSQVTFSGSTVTINPLTDLLPGTGYYVAIGPTAIEDESGNSFGGIWSPTLFNFTTAGPADTTAPTLIPLIQGPTTPPDNALDVAVTSNIVLRFSETVQPGSGNIEIYHAHNGFFGSYLFAGISASDSSQVTFSGNTVTINPKADLLDSEPYYVLINPGVIEDAAGNDFAGISSPTTFNFWTGTTPGDSSVASPALSPGDLATGVPVDENLVFTFNETVLPGTVPFQIRLVKDGSLVTSIYAWDTSQVTFAGNMVTVNPSVTLAPGTAYRVSYSDTVVDVSGNPLHNSPGGMFFTFTTTGAGDSTAPTLVSSSILNGAINVPLDSTLVLTFSEPVKPAGTGSFTFQNVNDPFDAITVGSSDTDYVSISGNVVTVTLPRPFESNSEYLLVFGTPSFSDLLGNTFNGDAIDLQFTTQTVLPDYADDYSAILSGFSWNKGLPDKPTIVTYSFETSAQPQDALLSNFDLNVLASFQPFTIAEKNLSIAALAQWGQISGIIFLEASPGLGDIQFAKYDFELFQDQDLQESAAFSYYPAIYSDGSLANSYQYFRTLYDLDGHPFFFGNVYVNTNHTTTTGLLLHEIGHALGLKHPFEDSPILDPALDNSSNTVMSYTGNDPSVLGPLDIAAIQYLYGTQADDGTHLTSWSWNANVLTQAGSSDDDTIRGVYSSNVISGLGGNDLIVGGVNNDSIDGGADQDRLFGDKGNDTLNGGTGHDVLAAAPGNDYVFGGHGDDLQFGESGSDVVLGGLGDDTLTPGEGDDTVDGGAGIDTAVFSGPSFNYSISENGGQVVVAALSGTGLDGADTLRNIERLVFTDQTIDLSPLASPPYSTSDFNGDGRADILWQNDNGLPALWLMNGTTRIGSGDASNPGPGWHAKGTGDFNGDAKADILWQHDDGRAAVWLFNGTTQIGGGQVSSNPGPQWHVRTSGDFNGDGNADILWQHNDGRAAIWLMNGSSILGTSVISDAASAWRIQSTGDFNGDGRADILWQKIDGQALIWLMNGTTQLGSGFVGSNPGPQWHAVGSADFNGDALADIVWQNDSGQVAVWLMDGTTQSGSALVGSNPGARSRVEGAGDANGDGKADILLQNDAGLATVWFLNGTSVVGGGNLSPDPGAQWHVANLGIESRRYSFDFDADGKTDFLWQNTSGQAGVWLLNGTVHIEGGSIAPNPGASWKMIDAGDFSGDGRADILWQNTNGEASIWFMNGATRIGGNGLSANPGTAWHAISAGDFNGDAKADILWQHDNGAPAIWLMDGTTRTGGGELAVNPGSAWHVVGSGDFNGDGRADILWQHDDGRADIWLMNGTTKLADAVVGSNPGPAWHAIGAGDFNGDGKSDIVWQHNDGTAAVWLIDGTTQIGGGVVGSNPGATWDVEGAGDFNSDGKADIKWQNDDGRAAVWLMDGTSFQASVLVGVNPGSDWHLV